MPSKRGKIRTKTKGTLSLLFVPHRGSLKTLRIKHYKSIFLIMATVFAITGTVGVLFTVDTYKENETLKTAIETNSILYSTNLSALDTVVSEQALLLKDTRDSMLQYETAEAISQSTLNSYKAEYEDMLVTYIDNSMSGESVSRGNSEDSVEPSFKDDVTTLKALLETVEEAAISSKTEETALSEKTAKLDSYLKHLPTFWPTDPKYSISSDYGRRFHPVFHYYKKHEGVDIGEIKGSDIYASASGTVTISEWRSGYGNLVEIDHGNGFSTRYGHCSKLLVKVGQQVVQSEKIALMGSTGTATGPHVHFEVRVNNTVVNPELYISK